MPGALEAKGPFGIALRRFRHAADRMSQDALADVSGVNQWQISRYERAEGSPTIEEVAALERGLGLVKGTLIFASGAAVPATSVEEAICQDPELSVTGKTHLLQVYEFVKATMVDPSTFEEDDESSDTSESDS